MKNNNRLIIVFRTFIEIRCIQTAILLALVICTACLFSCASVRPSGSASIIQEAEGFFLSGDPEKGFQLLENSIIKQPEDLSLSNYYRAKIVANNQENRSIAFFKKLSEGTVLNEIYYDLAFAYIDKIPRVGPMGAGFLSKRSISEFRKVLERDPDNWIANYGIGMNYLHWPDYFKKKESALQYFQRCLAYQRDTIVKPQYILVYIRLGDVYVRMSEVAKGREIWEEGLRLFPNQSDLTVRLNTEENKIVQLIKDLYNPNHSIGAIDTDISILWADKVPESIIPLYAKVKSKNKGIGGQLAVADKVKREKGYDLFSWFQRNLPFLVDKKHLSLVDMSPLGIVQKSDAAEADKIAYAMIRGFMTILEDNNAGQIRKEASEIGDFLKPFYYEGVGMGYAAQLDIEGRSLTEFPLRMSDIEPHFSRLQYAGAGMWFGLQKYTNIDEVGESMTLLGPSGSSYAYEGFGFAVVLFHLKNNSEAIRTGERLPSLAARSFYHGAGRAFWILGGKDVYSLGERLESVPKIFRNDSISGYGMGVSFTKVEDLPFVNSLLAEWDSEQTNINELLVGIAMGYSIRYEGDPTYIENIMSSAPEKSRCIMVKSVEAGKKALIEISQTSTDLHSNWRSLIRKEVSATMCN